MNLAVPLRFELWPLKRLWLHGLGWHQVHNVALIIINSRYYCLRTVRTVQLGHSDWFALFYVNNLISIGLWLLLFLYFALMNSCSHSLLQSFKSISVIWWIIITCDFRLHSQQYFTKFVQFKSLISGVRVYLEQLTEQCSFYWGSNITKCSV